MTIPEGTFTSPGYPGSYPNVTSDCRWLLQVPNRRTVTIEFTEFDIPYSDACMGDSVSVYDGSRATGLPVGRYCGQVGNKTPQDDIGVVSFNERTEFY